MCGRFALDIDNRFYPRFKIRLVEPLISNFNISPGPDVPVVIRQDLEQDGKEANNKSSSLEKQGKDENKDYPNQIKKMHWGLKLPWMKHSEKKFKLINAKVETIFEKPIFKNSLIKRRCIVPASGFFEWQRKGDLKVPYYIFNKNGDYMALAGIYESWEDESEGIVETFAVITTGANELLNEVHSRMPVILEPEEEEIWLDKHVFDTGLLNSILDPYPDRLLDLHQVSKAVNFPQNNGKECIQPIKERD